MQFRKSKKAVGFAQTIVRVDPNNPMNLQFSIPTGVLNGNTAVPMSAQWWEVGQPQSFQTAMVNPLANVRKLDSESGIYSIIAIGQFPDDEFIPEGSGFNDTFQWYDWNDVFLNIDPAGNPVTPPSPGDDVFIQVRLYDPELWETKARGDIGLV